MATNVSPCKGSYVLNQFPSNVMFGMNGFHVSASGAIQGHHGPLVLDSTSQIKEKYGNVKHVPFVFLIWWMFTVYDFRTAGVPGVLHKI